MIANTVEQHAPADVGNLSAGGVEAVVQRVVAPIVRRKLHVTLDSNDTSRRNQDAIDIVGHVQVILLSEIDRTSESNGAVRDLASYASSVAANACYKYFRDRFPERTRLRNKLRYILTHDPRLALWKTSAGAWSCGAAEFAGSDERVRVNQDEFQSTGSDACSLVSMLATLFAAKAGPVSFDDLVLGVATALKIKEPFELSNDVADVHNVPADPAPAADLVLEWASRLERLWLAVLSLRPEHRKALLLNLRDGTGDNLLAAFPMSRVASVRDIAAALEISLEQLAQIWNSLPWDDHRIAEYLGCRRQQVINLRQTARTKLARWQKEKGNI